MSRTIPIRVVAIPTGIAEAVRNTHLSPKYGHPTSSKLATGYGPCRHCLQPFAAGIDSRTLFTYDPFDGLERVPLPGPIFIHTEACERYAEDGGYPELLRQYPSVLSAYALGKRLLEDVEVEDGSQPEAIQKLLQNPEIAYIHVRDRNAGCYDFRVEAPV